MTDEQDIGDDSQFLAEVSIREDQVNKLLQKKDKVNALITALYNPPVQAKSTEIKVIY